MYVKPSLQDYFSGQKIIPLGPWQTLVFETACVHGSMPLRDLTLCGRAAVDGIRCDAFNTRAVEGIEKTAPIYEKA